MTSENPSTDLPVRLGPHTGLVVVDMQADFALRTGSLYVPGAEEIVEPVNRLVRAVSEAGGTVAYTQDLHPAQTPHFVTQGGLWPPHCVAGTPGAELLPELVVVGDVVPKGTQGEDGYSGFSVRDPLSGEQSPTVLESLLRTAGVTTVVVVGLAGDYCVGETAIDAAGAGFTTLLPLDLTRFVNLRPGDDAAMVERARGAGVDVVGRLPVGPTAPR
jgi:nicotinamidase/pyrazinamidase